MAIDSAARGADHTGHPIQAHDHRMMSIDTNTLFLVLITVGIVIAVMLAIVGKGVDKSLLIWSVAYACHGVGFLLIALRGSIPDFASILLANLLLAATYALFAAGLLTFVNRRMSPLLVWSPVILIAVVFPLLYDQLSTRIVVSGLVNFVQMILLLSIMFMNNNQLVGRGKLILSVCFVAGIGVTLARPAAIMLGYAEIASFNSPGLLQAFTFLTITILNIVIALALVLMQKEQAEAATDSIARSDELTGLPNRRSLYERLAQVAADRKSGMYGGLILLDLDNFKILNDGYGHEAGDRLLKEAASRLLHGLPRAFTVARLGGDEFVVLMPGVGEDENSAANSALANAEKMQKALAEPYQLSIKNTASADVLNIVHHSTATLGVTVFQHGTHNREDLLREADKAMYSAKNKQRGSIQLADS